METDDLKTITRTLDEIASTINGARLHLDEIKQRMSILSEALRKTWVSMQTVETWADEEMERRKQDADQD